MRRVLLALLPLLLMAHQLPKQDVKVTTTTLPSGVMLVQTAEGQPFDVIGLQMVLRFDVSNAERKAVELAVQKELEGSSLPPKTRVKPLERSGSGATIYSVHIRKTSPRRLEAALNEIVVCLGQVIANQDPGRKYFVPCNVTLHLMGGFQKHLKKDLFSGFLAQEDGRLVALPRILQTVQSGFASLFSMKLLAQKAPQDPFDTLTLSKSEADKISTIIHAMGQDWSHKLLGKQRKLRSLGRDIENVHTLRFLCYIFKNPRLAEDVREFRGSYFRWREFVGGCRRKLDFQADKNNVKKHVPGFCRELGLDYSAVMEKVNARDWDGLVEMLL